MTKRKSKPAGFPNLMQMAKHKPCLLRLPEICNGDRTTRGAHVRRALIAGGGQKPTDLALIWCCQSCADVTDNPTLRPQWMSSTQLDQHMLHGLCRTLAEVGKAIGV